MICNFANIENKKNNSNRRCTDEVVNGIKLLLFVQGVAFFQGTIQLYFLNETLNIFAYKKKNISQK